MIRTRLLAWVRLAWLLFQFVLYLGFWICLAIIIWFHLLAPLINAINACAR